MVTRKQQDDQDLELDAMAIIYNALKSLNGEAQSRVLDYVMRRLSLKDSTAFTSRPVTAVQLDQESEKPDDDELQRESSKNVSAEDAEEFEGVSAVGQKWMRRNSFSTSKISPLFSLGVDEIDLVAKSVPGKNKIQKFRNVFLLQGIASYLSGGVARVDPKKLRQAAGHYGVDPENNMWNYVQSMSAEVSGSMSSGFTLTARGLNAATELVRELTSAK
jgi:hypothetical protein